MTVLEFPRRFECRTRVAGGGACGYVVLETLDGRKDPARGPRQQEHARQARGLAHAPDRTPFPPRHGGPKHEVRAPGSGRRRRRSSAWTSARDKTSSRDTISRVRTQVAPAQAKVAPAASHVRSSIRPQNDTCRGRRHRRAVGGPPAADAAPSRVGGVTGAEYGRRSGPGGGSFGPPRDGSDRRLAIFGMVEAAGVEPASESTAQQDSTCVAVLEVSLPGVEERRKPPGSQRRFVSSSRVGAARGDQPTE